MTNLHLTPTTLQAADLHLLQIPSLDNPETYSKIAEKNPLGAALLAMLMVTAILYRVLPYLLDRRKSENGPPLEERRRREQDKWDQFNRTVAQLTLEVRELMRRIEALEEESHTTRAKLSDLLKMSVETNTLMKEVVKRLDRSGV